MWWDGDGFGVGRLIFGGVTMLLFWGLLILAIIALVRYMTRASGRGSRPTRAEHQAAEQVLAERFARGEVDEQAYRRGMEVLREQHSPAGGR